MFDLDDASREYFQDTHLFADLFNYRLFNGEQVLRPDSLTPLPESVSSGGDASRRRDVLKRAVLCRQDGVTYALFGIENQASQDPTMPLRCLTYDTCSYNDSFKALAGRNAEAGRQGMHFASKVCPGDRVPPVITIVVYWSPHPWTAPLTLHELVDFPDPRLREFAADYRLNLLEPCKIGDNDFARFHTKLGDMLHYVKVSNDKHSALDFLKNCPSFKEPDERSLRLLLALLPKRGQEKLAELVHNPIRQGGIDMQTTFKTLDELWDEQTREESLAKGREEGLAEGARRMANTLLAMDMPSETIIAALRQNFNLTEAQAKSWLAHA